MTKTTAATELPIYDRAIARFPHLAWVKGDAKLFCQTLCRLAAVQTITAMEYWHIASVANGGEW